LLHEVVDTPVIGPDLTDDAREFTDKVLRVLTPPQLVNVARRVIDEGAATPALQNALWRLESGGVQRIGREVREGIACLLDKLRLPAGDLDAFMSQFADKPWMYAHRYEAVGIVRSQVGMICPDPDEVVDHRRLFEEYDFFDWPDRRVRDFLGKVTGPDGRTAAGQVALVEELNEVLLPAHCSLFETRTASGRSTYLAEVTHPDGLVGIEHLTDEELELLGWGVGETAEERAARVAVEAALHEAVGRVVVASASMEYAMLQLFCRLIGTPLAEVTALGDSYKSLYENCRTLLQYRSDMSDEDARYVKELLDQVHQQMTARNKMAHGIWSTPVPGDEAEPLRYTVTSLRPEKQRTRSFTLDEIHGVAVKLDLLAHQLHEDVLDIFPGQFLDWSDERRSPGRRAEPRSWAGS
jgi:hypothetical protein